MKKSTTRLPLLLAAGKIIVISAIVIEQAHGCGLLGAIFGSITCFGNHGYNCCSDYGFGNNKCRHEGYARCTHGNSCGVIGMGMFFPLRLVDKNAFFYFFVKL